MTTRASSKLEYHQTAHQVDSILWREIRKLLSRSGRCLACKRGDEERKKRGELVTFELCKHSAPLTGDLHELARSGLRSPDFREITGHTAKEAESMAGISDRRLLYITDEASGVRDEIHVAIRGGRPRIRALSARQPAEPRRSSPFPEPFLQMRRRAYPVGELTSGLFVSLPYPVAARAASFSAVGLPWNASFRTTRARK